MERNILRPDYFEACKNCTLVTQKTEGLIGSVIVSCLVKSKWPFGFGSKEVTMSVRSEVLLSGEPTSRERVTRTNINNCDVTADCPGVNNSNT